MHIEKMYFYDYSSEINTALNNESVKLGAFADSRRIKVPDPEPMTIPFSNLLSPKTTPQQSPPTPAHPPSQQTTQPLPPIKNVDNENGNVPSRCGSVGSHNDDFILVDFVSFS